MPAMIWRIKRHLADIVTKVLEMTINSVLAIITDMAQISYFKILLITGQLRYIDPSMSKYELVKLFIRTDCVRDLIYRQHEDCEHE